MRVFQESTQTCAIVFRKPALEPYLRALDRLELRPSQACAVEDSKTGVISAKAAGIKVFGLGASVLGADQRIDDLTEILPIVGTA